MYPFLWLALGFLAGRRLRTREDVRELLETGTGYVGDEGSQYMQVPTAQETAQGYKKTDVYTLRVKATQLLDKTNQLSDDTGGQSPEVEGLKAALAVFQAQCVALEQHGVGNYFALSAKLVEYTGQLADIMSRAVPNDEPAPPPAPASAFRPGAPAPKPAPPPAPLVVKPAGMSATKKVALAGLVGLAAAYAASR